MTPSEKRAIYQFLYIGDLVGMFFGTSLTLEDAKATSFNQHMKDMTKATLGLDIDMPAEIDKLISLHGNQPIELFLTKMKLVDPEVKRLVEVDFVNLMKDFNEYGSRNC